MLENEWYEYVVQVLESDQKLGFGVQQRFGTLIGSERFDVEPF